MRITATITGTLSLSMLGIPSPRLDVTHPDWPLFRTRINKLVAGGASDGYKITDLLYFWDAEGRQENAIRDCALAQFRTELMAAMVRWNANLELTTFSGDSYLQSGLHVREWCLVLDWCKAQLTAQELADGLMIVRQAVWNIWNYTQAKWGTTLYPWTGWSTSNPANNYYYSFFEATSCAMLTTGDADLTARVPAMLTALANHFQANLAGGGSREGTGYGQSYMTLFRVFLMLRYAGVMSDATLAAMRVDESLEYWSRATTPDYKSFVPIGDQSRVSYPAWYDYEHALLVLGIRLVPDSLGAAHARYVISKAGPRAMQGLSYYQLCRNIPGTVTPPPTDAYVATGTGHTFAAFPRGMMSYVAGFFNESHDSQSQGEVQLYLDGLWRMVTANVRSHSGIRQQVDYHNCLAFKRAGVIIPQVRKATPNSTQTVVDSGGVVAIGSDLKAAYNIVNKPIDVNSYTRGVVLDRTAQRLSVSDRFSVPAGVTASWRASFLDLPTINADGSVTAGPLTVRCTTPGVTATVTSLHAINVDWLTDNCWLVEFSGATEYDVIVSWS